MKHIDVSLDIETTSLSVTELTLRLGVDPSPGSRDGVPASRGAGWRPEATYWRLDSRAGATATIEEHIRDLVGRVPVGILRRNGGIPEDACLYLSIGIYSDGPMASLVISPAVMRALDAAGIQLSLSFYCCGEDTPPS